MEIKWNGASVLASVSNLTMNAMIDAAEQVKKEIKNSFTDPGDYKLYVRRGKEHWSSRPGQTPAVWKGRLKDSISVNWFRSGMPNGKVDKRAKITDGVSRPSSSGTVVIGTNCPYANYLETGTSKMAARPFLRPARQVAKEMIKNVFTAGLKTSLGGKTFLRDNAGKFLQPRQD